MCECEFIHSSDFEVFCELLTEKKYDDLKNIFLQFIDDLKELEEEDSLVENLINVVDNERKRSKEHAI